MLWIYTIYTLSKIYLKFLFNLQSSFVSFGELFRQTAALCQLN